jgi:hypothetical protein
MLWLRRNLWLAVGGLLGLALLVLGGLYLWTSIERNKKFEGSLEEAKEALERIYTKIPFPSRENITAATEAVAQVEKAAAQAKTYFSQVPAEKVSGQDFKILLDNSIDRLRKKADQASVALPGKTYAFSFEAQKNKLTFAPGSFPGLAEQLAEIEAICNLLFESRINRLVNVRRTRLTVDDPPGATDYHDLPIETNKVFNTPLAVVIPYQFEFQCFTAELGAVLENVQKSRHGLSIRSILIEPVQTQPGDGPLLPGEGGIGQPPPPGVLPPPAPVRPPGGPGRMGPPRGPRPPQAAPGAGAAAAGLAGYKTVLNERLLRVLVLVDVIRALK